MNYEEELKAKAKAEREAAEERKKARRLRSATDASVDPDFALPTHDARGEELDDEEREALETARTQFGVQPDLGGAQVEQPEGPEASTGIMQRFQSTQMGRLPEQLAANPALDPRVPGQRSPEERPDYVDSPPSSEAGTAVGPNPLEATEVTSAEPSTFELKFASESSVALVPPEEEDIELEPAIAHAMTVKPGAPVEDDDVDGPPQAKRLEPPSAWHSGKTGINGPPTGQFARPFTVRKGGRTEARLQAANVGSSQPAQDEPSERTEPTAVVGGDVDWGAAKRPRWPLAVIMVAVLVIAGFIVATATKETHVEPLAIETKAPAKTEVEKPKSVQKVADNTPSVAKQNVATATPALPELVAPNPPKPKPKPRPKPTKRRASKRKQRAAPVDGTVEKTKPTKRKVDNGSPCSPRRRRGKTVEECCEAWAVTVDGANPFGYFNACVAAPDAPASTLKKRGVSK